MKPTTNRPSFQSGVCPWWLIRTLDNPLRRLFQNPEEILKDFVRTGDACLDVGCGIGYFTIPMAKLAGPSGNVTAVDLQPQMLAGVERRAGTSPEGLPTGVQVAHVRGERTWPWRWPTIQRIPSAGGRRRHSRQRRARQVRIRGYPFVRSASNRSHNSWYMRMWCCWISAVLAPGACKAKSA